MYSQGPRNEGHYSDALAIKAIVPEKVQHDSGEQIAIIFNHRLNMDRKSKDQYVVDFVGTAGAVKVQATLANSSTLMLQTPVYKEPSVITAYVYQGIHRRLIGQHKIEFLSRSDTFYRLLYKSLDPVIFMCDTLGIVSGDIHELDNALAETFSANAPQGFDFLGIHKEGADQSSAEFPTLLHFASKFGLSKLVEVILRYPGAYEACSLKNYQGHRPYNIAEDNGYDQLANELRAFHDQKDPDASYIDMDPNNKDGDVFVKMQKEDGSYYYVLRKEADNELYVDLDDKPEHEEYYVKMQKEGGGYYYVPMKPGAGPKKIDHAVDKPYSNVEGHGEHYQEDIYENLNQTDPSPESQEIYEDMDGEGNVGSEEFYVEMEHSEKSTTISGGVHGGADEELYMQMAHEGDPASEELYTDMEAQQKPDKYGYVTPRSNQPVTTDAMLFNRSASSAAEVRARQLADAERKSCSLPGGVSHVDVLEQAIRQSVISGKISGMEASQFLQKLDIPQRGLEERRGSTGSKASISTASSSGSSSSGVSSGHELGPRDEPFEGASIEEEEEEDTRLTRAEILGRLHKPKDEPPTPPRPDYHQRDKTTGASDSSSRRHRHKTAPVETKDLPGMLSASGSRLPPPVQRRSSSPGGVGYNTQLKEPSSERQRPPEPIPESTPPKVAPRPSPRPPLSSPSDATRSPVPIPPSERVRYGGVPVLPMPTAKGTPPPQPPRRPPRPPRRVKTTGSSGGMGYNTQLEEPSSERQRLPEPIPGSKPRKAAPRPSPRTPLSPPSDETRSPAPIPPSERVRQMNDGLEASPWDCFLPLIIKDNSPRKGTSVLCGTVSSEGGVLLDENVKLICPPGAVDNSLSVSVTLEDPSKYYGQFVLKDLENNVMFCAPIISLEPSGHFFKKPLTLKIMVDINFNWDDVLILHGSKTSGGKVTWQDISHNSNINEANTGVVIEIEHFSIIAILYRLSRSTLLCTKDIISRLNLLAFNYTLSVLLKKSSPSLVHDELALLFVSQDVYHEQFYREDDTSSALMQLKKEGFVELHVRCSQDEKSIYNNETLEVIIRLGEDYKLADSQQESTNLTVHSYDWWHKGKVLRIPLEWSNDVRSLCGKVSVRGDYGHTSESHFSELELCGYVKSLLGVEGAIFNVMPIAKLLEMPEESLNSLTKSQKDENEQLEIVLQHWSKRNNVVEGLAALRKDVESLKQEDYKVTGRGQMHIRHLRKVAFKILGLQLENAYSQNYFIRKIQNLCKSVFSDCCIELEVTADKVERAASSTNHAQYLIQSIENRCPLPQDIKRKYQEVCSVFEKSTIRTFLIIVPYLIQNIKVIFADERITEVPQNGLRGLTKETLDHFVSSVRNATGDNGFFELLCDSCNLLEQLCLENYDKEPNTETEKWAESMAILPMLKYLHPFFQHCCKDVRLYKRLDLFVRCLRKTIADHDCIDELFVHDLSNVLMSLIHFAKIDPSKVVRFELNSSTDLPFSCPRETVRYDRREKTYSQVFRIKRETEDELQLHATARVYIDGGICKKGTFQSTMMLTPSSEEALNGYVTRFHDVTVTKLEDKDSGNLRVFFSTTRKEKLLELLDVLRKELRGNGVDKSRPEVTWCPLSMRSVVTLKADTVLNLRLVYKWGSEGVDLDSKDFVAYARSSHLQCVGSSKEPILFDEQLGNAGRNQLEEGRPVRESTVNTSSGDMQIFIRMMDEREITMEVNRSDHIRKVKRDIHRLYQYPSDSQRLVFAGMRLEDNCSLSDYNIQNRSTLYLVQRLRGIAYSLHRETDGHGPVRLG